MEALRLVLASASPRRRELLGLLGVAFDVVAAEVDETPTPGEAPRELAVRLAASKATTVSATRPDALVLGADTVVALDGESYGKPGTDDEARRMLRELAGRWHDVFTGVVLARAGTVRAAMAVHTRVQLDPLTPERIDWYVATGEPHDKAGAYAIQGAGGIVVRSIEGSPSNVVGLPLAELVDLLAADPAWSSIWAPSVTNP